MHEDLEDNVHTYLPGLKGHGASVAGHASAVTDNDTGKSSIGFNCKLWLQHRNIYGLEEALQMSIAGARIINLSFGGSTSNESDIARVEEIHSRGTIIIASAMNNYINDPEDPQNIPMYPASYPHVISVTGVDENYCHFNSTPGTPNGESLNHCETVDLCAPGYNVLTLIGNDSYQAWGKTGTSFSAPIVAGLCGLILSANPCLSPDEVENILKTTATNIYPYCNNMDAYGELGAGLINAEAALEMATGGVPRTFFNFTIEEGENITWTENKFVLDILSVKEDASLTIESTIKLNENAAIVIEPGGTLTIGNNGVLMGACDDYWDGQIKVKKSATIVLGSNSQIMLGGNGHILIDFQDGLKANLFVEPGAEISLQDENTKIEIKGRLQLAENTEFTYRGAGYIRFSTPGISDIIAGYNSSINLTGTGIDNKILEIATPELLIPDYLESFSLENGKVIMEDYDARIRLENSTVVNINQVKFTTPGSSRTNHHGLYLDKVDDVTINSSTFENGKYGVYSYGSTNTSSIAFNNCDFTNCYYGLISSFRNIYLTDCGFANCYYGLRSSFRNIYLTNCDFIKNQYGLYSTSMSSSSVIDNCTFDSNYRGIYFNGYSFSSLALTETDIINNDYGLFLSGSFTGFLECCIINDNKNYGIYYYNGASLDMSGNSNSTRNSLINNDISIRTRDGRYLYLSNGYNNLSPDLDASTGKAVSGTLSGYGCNPTTIMAEYNQWNWHNEIPVSGVDYSLATSNCFNTIILRDDSPRSESCSKSNGSVNKTGDGTNDEPIHPPIEASIINTTNFPDTYLDDAVNQVIAFIEDINNPINNEEAIDLLGEIMLYEIDEPNTKDKWYIGLAYNYMGRALGSALENGEIENKTAENNMIKKALKVKAKLLRKDFANDYHNSLFTGIDMAHVLHISGESKKAIKLLNKMLNNAEEDDLDYINYVLCLIETEIAIEEGNIQADEIEEAYSLCEYEETEENKSGDVKETGKTGKLNMAILSEIENGDLKDIIDQGVLRVIPNPVTGLSQIIVSLEKGQKAVIRIYNIQGKLIAEYPVGANENIVSISNDNYKEGIYQLVLYKNRQATENCKMMISK